MALVVAHLEEEEPDFNWRVKMEKIIKCPKCKKDMLKLSNGKYIIDKCPKCKGIFLDKIEIDAIKEQGFISYVLNYFRND